MLCVSHVTYSKRFALFTILQCSQCMRICFSFGQIFFFKKKGKTRKLLHRTTKMKLFSVSHLMRYMPSDLLRTFFKSQNANLLLSAHNVRYMQANDRIS